MDTLHPAKAPNAKLITTETCKLSLKQTRQSELHRTKIDDAGSSEVVVVVMNIGVAGAYESESASASEPLGSRGEGCVGGLLAKAISLVLCSVALFP